MRKKRINKQFFIKAFFEDFRIRINSVKRIIQLGFKEEGIILALCQIDALSNFRYNPKIGQQKEYFKKLLNNYSGIPRISYYADDFYRYFRCAGVHKGRVSVSRQTNVSRNRIFSAKGALCILENCFTKIKQECLERNKWPYEL